MDGEDGRYEDDLEGNVLCLFLRSGNPNEVLFCRIRRTGLPQLENAGELSELPIPDNTGLSEAIHISFFPENIVGMVYNHFGPRISRLSTYLNVKSQMEIPVVTFRALLNADVSKKLDLLDDIRLFEFNVHPSYADVIRQNDNSIGDILDANIRFQGPDDVVHIILKYSGSRRQIIRNKTIDIVKKLLFIDNLAIGASNSIMRFKVRGKRIDTGRVDTIDLLGDRIISTQSIVRMSDRGRALHPDSAFQAINVAYRNVKAELDQAYSISQ